MKLFIAILVSTLSLPVLADNDFKLEPETMRYDGKRYDRQGLYQGKTKDGKVYDRRGSYQGKFVDKGEKIKIYDRNGRYIGTIKK